MTAIELLTLILLALCVGLCIAVLVRTRSGPSRDIRALTARINEMQAAVGAGFNGLRDENSNQARLGREELSNRLDALSSTLVTALGQIGSAQGERIESLGKSISNARIETQTEAATLRSELLTNFETLTQSVGERMNEQARVQAERLDLFARNLSDHRTTTGTEAARLREEVSGTLTKLGERLDQSLEGSSKRQGEALLGVSDAVTRMGEANERRQEAHTKTLTESVQALAEANERRGEGLRQSVEGRLDAIRTENGAKLEEMRVTVDEKLQGTLNERLGASFSMVNENLERVHKSVGETQQIATGVGDLKRVLTNVKTRGTYGETSLGMMLEQVMASEQYAENVAVKPGSRERVEFAIKLPGQDDGGEPVWLPIDAKFPQSAYERLMEASERADTVAIDEATAEIEREIRRCGKDIATKYVDPPHTTDFGIMYLPTEGLFAEVVRRPGLVDALHRDHRVVVAGPTTLMALLSSLRMGFRTLAVQKRSSEVWQVLGAVKTEFGKFGGIIDKANKKLAEAQNIMEDARKKSTTVGQKLRSVEALPEAEAQTVLGITAETLADELEAATE